MDVPGWCGADRDPAHPAVCDVVADLEAEGVAIDGQGCVRVVMREEGGRQVVVLAGIWTAKAWPNGADLDPDMLYDPSLEPASGRGPKVTVLRPAA